MSFLAVAESFPGEFGCFCLFCFVFLTPLACDAPPLLCKRWPRGVSLVPAARLVGLVCCVGGAVGCLSGGGCLVCFWVWPCLCPVGGPWGWLGGLGGPVLVGVGGFWLGSGFSGFWGFLGFWVGGMRFWGCGMLFSLPSPCFGDLVGRWASGGVFGPGFFSPSPRGVVSLGFFPSPAPWALCALFGGVSWVCLGDFCRFWVFCGCFWRVFRFFLVKSSGDAVWPWVFCCNA